MTQPVAVRLDEDIAVLLIDNPPVNAMSHHLREALARELAALRDDAAISAIVIACAGRTFVSGADITEFGTPRATQTPNLPELCALLERIPKPTVAAIHGTALGGGLEFAMACHFRVADSAAKLGLPEVKLGLLPGSGGTVRLPRLVGGEKAVEMIVSGTPIGAAEARHAGLVDEVASGDLLASAISFARAVIHRGALLVPVRDRDARLADARDNPSALNEAIRKATARARGLEAPIACAQAVRNAIALPFDEALAKERQTFLKLVAGTQSRAQRHLFFAEREAAKVAGLKGVEPRPIRRVGVIGAGTMGGGIAMAMANGGLPVTVLEMNADALAKGLRTIGSTYTTSVARGSLDGAERNRRMERISGTTDYADLAECDLIIEAVFEEMSVKKEVFARLDAVARPRAILATNTSYLDIDEIAQATSRPQDVLGLHFFSPANVMRLLEIVRGEATAPDALAAALELARRIGKVAVVVGVCHGFVGNRMLAARSAENEDLLLEGASPEQIDRVFADFGWPMGPFRMGDLAGLDIGWRNRKALGKTAPIADALCEMGRFGQKTGRGFYLYEAGTREATPDPEVTALIEAEARRRGVNRREISDDEITERTLYPMINEATKILEEGVAARPSDIDLVWVNGYGFPIGKGGPMFWADLEGLPKILDRLEHWHGRMGRPVFAPTETLRQLAATGGSFSARPAAG